MAARVGVIQARTVARFVRRVRRVVIRASVNHIHAMWEPAVLVMDRRKSSRYLFFLLFGVLLQTACTTNQKVYTGAPGEQFDAGNTAAAILAIGAAALIANEAAKGGGYYPPPSYYQAPSSCAGPYCNQVAAWDYLPGSAQWRCRDTGGYRGGQFVPDWECARQYKVDNWQ